MSGLKNLIDVAGGASGLTDLSIVKIAAIVEKQGYVDAETRRGLYDSTESLIDLLRNQMFADQEEAFERVVELNRETAQHICMMADVDAEISFHVAHALVWLWFVSTTIGEIEIE